MKIPNEILSILDASSTIGARLVLPAQLERKTYTAVAKVIEAAGGKWDRRAGAHVFPGTAAEAIDQIILTGEVVAGRSYQQETQQFFTPPALADRVANVADIAIGDTVLEPSAGAGALAYAAKARGGKVFCVEQDPKLCVKLGDVGDVLQGDFLELAPSPPKQFDAVIMNPPFANQADIRHVMHAARFLAPGGRLAAIMSPSFTFRANALAVEFRAFLAANKATVEPLPEGSFKSSGTGVNTVLVAFNLAA